ncbi:hypothetical protein DY000_02049818 [Brassica cretica]|uniref:DUF4005 domain-containing protein n=1 Tax=Brassica cretica TaxID=69181 RepID=A0ABQ7EZA4_BRACR|nr:hypothetical protein DY000_02049818 [Brassica cretica]
MALGKRPGGLLDFRSNASDIRRREGREPHPETALPNLQNGPKICPPNRTKESKIDAGMTKTPHESPSVAHHSNETTDSCQRREPELAPRSLTKYTPRGRTGTQPGKPERKEQERRRQGGHSWSVHRKRIGTWS